MIWLGLATLIVVFVVGFRVLTSHSRRAIRRLSERLGITPVPLEHSKLTFGYLLESAHSRVAWLSYTAGLPDKTVTFLLNNQPQAMIIDCSHEPRPETPRNHCDLNTVIALNEVIGCPQVILTHISHQFDVWMMDNPLPSGIEAGYDGMVLVLD